MVWYDKEWENPFTGLIYSLTYTPHATDRTIERDLPFIDFLPIDAKYMYRVLKDGIYALTFEITLNYKTVHIALNPYGRVITVYPKVKSRADEFQYKYNRYLGSFKPPADYMPTITLDDFTDDYIEGTV